MTDDHQPSLNGRTMSFNGDGDNNSSATIDDLMRKMENTGSKQQILLQGTDDVNTYPIYCKEVSIVASTASGSTEPSAGSNKVRINPAVKHDWEQKYYLGNIVASHKNSIYIAYVLKIKLAGAVRIINRKTAQRALLKGFEGQVLDIAFAHVNDVLLACVDSVGTLHVYTLEEGKDDIKTTLLVKILRPENCPPTTQHRVLWCPYIPDPDSTEDDDEPNDDVGKLLVVTHDNLAEMYCLETITARKPPNLTLISIEIPDGYQVLPGHEKLITDAVFSPDGSALATACLDGEVRVFSVAINDDATPPKCLHKWKPHDGWPISMLVFLDNYKVPQQQFWKFALTGANYNQEIKLWSCVSWTCLQTIRLFPPPDLVSPSVEPCLKACVDSTADYLILSDINRKAMYVFNIEQNWEAGRAHIGSVSEFLLTSPCVSFTVLDAGRRKCKKTSEGDNLQEYTTGDQSDDEAREEEETIVCTFIRMYAVHTKALQELQIQYEPDSVLNTGSISSMSQDDAGFRDALTDVSVETSVSDVDVPSLAGSYHSNKDGGAGKPLLLTPDAFSASPRKYGELDSLASSISTNSSSFTQVTPVRDRDDDGALSYRSPSNSTLVQSGEFCAPGSGAQTPQQQTPHTPQQTSVTPSSIPLPPVTPGEEERISQHNNSARYNGENNASFASQDYEQNFAKTEPNAFSSPRTMPNSSSESWNRESRESTEKDDASKPVDFGTSESVRALFAAASQASRSSASSSRSGSIEVDTILNRSQERGTLSPANVAPAAPPQAQEGGATASPRGPYDSTIWPKAPDVAGEAKRLVTEVLHNSGADKDDITDGDMTTEAANETEEQTEKDDDVQVEVVEISSGEENDVQITSVSETDAGSSGELSSRRTGGAQTQPAADPALFNKLQSQLLHLTTLLTAQQEELSQLRREVKTQHTLLHHHQQHHQQLIQMSSAEHRSGSPRDHSYLERIDAQISDLNISISRQVDSTLARFADEQKCLLETMAVERTNSERQRHDRMAASIATQVATATAGRLDKTIKQEMKTSVLPVVGRVLDPVRDQLHVDMAQKLTATDQLMRDSINKIVNNRQTIELIGQSAGAAVQGQVQAAYRETLHNHILPSFDRSCQEMYKQVNDAFLKGTKEYQSQVESQTDRLSKKITSQLRQNVDNLPKVTQDLQLNLAQTLRQELDSQMKQMTKSLQDTLSQHVKQVVRQEIDEAMKNQQDTIQTSVLHAMRSSAATPLPTQQSPDPQQLQAAIMVLLQQGQLNAAFQQALSASDLGLVMYVCETVNPQQLFSQDPCPLQQPVLLSLIQQLSADLTQSTDLKHRFLQEAIMNLDPANPVTKEHMPVVLNSLCTKLHEFINAKPAHKMAKQMRMLLMASQSLHPMPR